MDENMEAQSTVQQETVQQPVQEQQATQTQAEQTITQPEPQHEIAKAVDLESNFTYDSTKSMDENATELMELKASAEALKDTAFVEKVADIKKEQMATSAKANQEIHSAKKEAERVTAVTEIDKAFFEQWKTILNFGGITEPTTKNFAKFMLWIITPFYVMVTVGVTMPITIIKFLLQAINSLFEQIAKFGKIGRSIAFTLLIVGALALAAWVIYALVMHFVPAAEIPVTQ